MYRIVGIVGLVLVVGGLIIAAPGTVEAAVYQGAVYQGAVYQGAVYQGAVYQGTVIRVDADKNVIETADENELEQKFAVAEGCKITLDAKEADLKDLVSGTVVTITTKKVKGKAVAVKIEGRSPE